MSEADWNASQDSPDCPRSRSSASNSSGESKGNHRNNECETDAATLARRQKDIDYGKNTLGYDRYTQLIPK